jgi:hypothetical protein
MWPSRIWPLVGGVLILLSVGRWGTALLAWFIYVPFLYYTRTTQGLHSRVWLLLALFVFITLTTLKDTTPPVRYLFAPVSAAPGAMAIFLLLLLWELIRRCVGAALALYVFPALSIVAAWAQNSISGVSAFTLANTQLARY